MSSAGKISQEWVLLVYTLPREPSAPRVALWRKLKKLGALLTHDAVWTLPSTSATREQVLWLTQEIREAGGSAHVWIAREELQGQNDQLIAAFLERAEQGYAEILHALGDSTSSHADLARSYCQVRAIDYFNAPSGEQVRARLETVDK